MNHQFDCLIFPFFSFISFPGIFFAFIVVVMYLAYQDQQRRKANWRQLAAINRLTFVEGSWLGNGGYIYGTYRGHQLKLDTIPGGKNSPPHTRLVVAINRSVGTNFTPGTIPLGKQMTANEIVSLLLTIKTSTSLKAELKVQGDGYALYYEQWEIESDIKYLQYLFDLTTDLATGYLRILMVGSEAVPGLYEIARDGDHLLKHIAAKLIQEIGWQTTQRLRDRAENLFCPRCLTCCGEHKVNLHWWQTVSYYGCRLCGQSRQFIDGWVMAMLDSTMSVKTFKQDGVLQVNWLARRALFDFDEVHIVQATDEDVERFAVQVGNDTDPVRQPRYQGMRCLVSPDCRLSENTHRILARTFGQVVTESLNESQVV